MHNRKFRVRGGGARGGQSATEMVAMPNDGELQMWICKEMLEGIDGAYAGVCCIFHRNLKCMKHMKRMQHRAVRDSALEAW